MAVLAIFILSFITALTGALMPGPLLTVTIAQTARRGFIASVLLVIGHSLLEMALVIGLVLGLGHFLKLPVVRGSVAILGGAMLVWMGFNMTRDARRGVLDIDTSSQKSEIRNPKSEITTPFPRARGALGGILRSPIFTGIAVSITNPYWVIWWATAGLTFFTQVQSVLVAVIAFYIGHIMGDIVWYLLVGAAVTKGRRLINPAVYRGIVQVCGVFLVFLGGSFLYLLASGKLWTLNMTISGLK